MSLVPIGTPLYALGEVCACGSQCLSCPGCGGIRCLHCDPLEVDAESPPSCHEEDAVPRRDDDYGHDPSEEPE